MIRGHRAVLVALAMGLIVAACGATGSNGASPSASQLAPLAAGTHSSSGFVPTITFTVPDGWLNPVDDTGYFELVPVVDQNSGIHVFHNWQALSQDATCPYAPEPGVGTTSASLVKWIRSLKGLSVTQPAMVTVGGLPALTIDVTIAASWKQSCPFANGLPAVPLLIDDTRTLHWVLAGPETLRLYVLDVPGQGTLIVDLDSFDGVGYPTLLQTGSPIVKSLAIKTS